MPFLTFINSPMFEAGGIVHLNGMLSERGIKRPLICTDPGLKSTGLIDRLREVISNEYPWNLYDEVPPNPTEEAVEDAFARYKELQCDGLIGFGGGSSIDLAKGVGILASHGGQLSNYTIGRTPIEGSAPVIAIPTTAGTGSEVSNGSVIVMKDGSKLILASPHVVPSGAICDPDLTKGLIPRLTAGTGMDAVTHCIEAFLCPGENPPADAVALDGVQRAIGAGALERAVRDGDDDEARWNMMMASTEGAMAFTKGLGVVHAMSHACGAKRDLKLHHGTLNGVILPTILEYNKGYVDESKYTRIATAIGINCYADIADHIRRLNERIGLPPNLGSMGITKDMIPKLTEHCFGDICHLLAPHQPTEEDYEKLFIQAIG